MKSNTSINITLAELASLSTKNLEIIDMRDEHSFLLGHIPSAINMQPEQLKQAMQHLDKSKTLVVVCQKGELSIDVAKMLREQGVQAHSLASGYLGWLMQKFTHNEEPDKAKQVEQSLRKKFEKTILSNFTKAIKLYDLVQPNDKIAVCISGGKDSMLMAKLFQELKRKNKFDFELEFLVMDPGYNAENRQIIEQNAKLLGVPITVFNTDIFNQVYNIPKSPCYICARMRRGHLYNEAKKLGCNKIALGHHFDDVIETILMGMLYGAQVQTMMPKLHSTNFKGMQLIRPMYLVREQDILHWCTYNDLRFIQCACKFTDTCTSESCNAAESGSKRKEIKHLISALKQQNPQVEHNIFRSVENVNLSTIIAYKDKAGTHHFLDNY